MLLWLWGRLVASIPPLAWELPYASGGALKRKKKSLHLTTKGNVVYPNSTHSGCLGRLEKSSGG